MPRSTRSSRSADVLPQRQGWLAVFEGWRTCDDRSDATPAVMTAQLESCRYCSTASAYLVESLPAAVARVAPETAPTNAGDCLVLSRRHVGHPAALTWDETIGLADLVTVEICAARGVRRA